MNKGLLRASADDIVVSPEVEFGACAERLQRELAEGVDASHAMNRVFTCRVVRPDDGHEYRHSAMVGWSPLR